MVNKMNDEYNETYDLPPREGDTKTDEEGSWYFEDGMWWLE